MSRDVKRWIVLFGVVALATAAAATVACWMNWNHPLVAYQRIHVGMTMGEVHAELGLPTAEVGGGYEAWFSSWRRDGYDILVTFRRKDDGHLTVYEKELERIE